MPDRTTENIIAYYNDRVAQYGTAGAATLLDENMRALEIESVQRWLDPTDVALEIFCGNGVSTLEFAACCRRIAGCDLSEKMIEAARRNLEERAPRRGNVLFEQRNVLEIDRAYAPGTFTAVISVRGLINLPSWELQQAAIRKVWALLPPGGKFIFLEGSRDGLERINALRATFSLRPLAEPWYDNHFDASRLMEFMDGLFECKAERHLDPFFLVSRVLYPAACLPGEPEFGHLCNTVARLLVSHAETREGTTLLMCKLFVKR